MAESRSLFSRERLDGFSDAIFAFAMTLLVTELDVPGQAGAPGEALREIWPHLVYYLLAFVSVGALWLAFRMALHWVVAMDRTFIWLALLLFMGVALVPFLTELLGRFSIRALPTAVYGFHFAALILLLLALWEYATRRRRLSRPELEEAVVRSARRRLLLAAGFYAGAGALAFASSWASTAVYLLVPLLYVVPGIFGRGLGGALPLEEGG